MPKINIQIIEDRPAEAQQLRQYLEKYNYRVSGIADNLKDALGMFYAQKPDMVIIDIFLRGKPDGIAFARKMNENQATKKPFIFLTGAMDSSTFEAAKRTGPFGYLIKPCNELELHYAIELAIEKFENSLGMFSCGMHSYTMADQCFFIKKRNYLIKVPASSITHIEVQRKFLNIYSLSGSFLVELPMAEIIQKLPEKQFIRVNRSTVVNINKVQSVSTADNQIILDNNKRVLISRRNREYVMQHFDVLK